MLTAPSGSSNQDYQGELQQGTLGDQPGADLRCSAADNQTPRAWSRRECQGAQSRQGAAELILPGPALGEMRGDAMCFAGDASGQGEEASSERVGGGHRLAQAEACRPSRTGWRSSTP